MVGAHGIKSILNRNILGIEKRSRLVTDMAAFITRHASPQPNMKDSYGYFRERFIAIDK
jgi:hypothetical protein